MYARLAESNDMGKILGRPGWYRGGGCGGGDDCVGDGVTKAEKAHQEKVAAFGCIACWLDGIANPHVSIHHVNGRTKPGAHTQVLPLCAGHHQDGTGEDKTLIAVHPYKARFERTYGTQQSLLQRLAEWTKPPHA